MVQIFREKSEICFWINLKFAISMILENIIDCVLIVFIIKKLIIIFVYSNFPPIPLSPLLNSCIFSSNIHILARKSEVVEECYYEKEIKIK